MSESNSYGGAIVFAAGAIFGAVVVYFVLKKEPATTAQAMTPDLRAEVLRLETEIHRLRIENDELRLQLQIAVPQGPVVTAQASPLSLLKSAPKPAAPVVIEPPLTYKNTEKWKYEKDKLGRIMGLEISREAKHNV